MLISLFVRIVFVVGLLVQVPDAFVGNLLPRRIPAAVVEKFDQADNIWGMTNRMIAAEYGNLTLRQTQSLAVPTPSFVHILTQGILTITSFSILRKGSIFKYDYSRSTGGDQQQAQVDICALIFSQTYPPYYRCIILPQCSYRLTSYSIPFHPSHDSLLPAVPNHLYVRTFSISCRTRCPGGTFGPTSSTYGRTAVAAGAVREVVM